MKNTGGELTAAAAKTAVVEMMEQTDDDDLRPYLELLKGTEPKAEDDRSRGSIVKFGPLTCFIEKRRFVLLIVSADNREFIEWSGSFVRRGDKWVAEVEKKSQS
ncbi:MAG TPA: hypothetical protein VGG30_08425 [Pirellulales bacterium]